MFKTLKKAVNWYATQIEENNAWMPSCMIPLHPKQ